MSLSANIILIPALVYYLDGDKLGLWYIFGSIGSIAALFDFGFNVTFSRNITYCWSGIKSLQKDNVIFNEEGSNVDYKLMKTVLTTCKRIYLILSGSALLFLLSCGTAYIIYISHNMDGYEHIVAWVIYSFAVFMNLYFGYYASFLRGVGAISSANKNTIIARMVQITGTFIFLAGGLNLIGACIAYFLYGTVFRVLGRRKFYSYQNIGQKLEEVTENTDQNDIKDVFNTVWHNAWKEGLVALSNYGSNQATTIICSIFLSLSETGVYSLGMQLATAVSAISATLWGAYQPQLQSAYVSQKTIEIKKIMSVIVVSYIFFYIIGITLVVFIGFPFLKWLKPEIDMSVLVFLGLCVYQFVLQFRSCYTSYFSCTNRLIYYKAFVISVIISILLSILTMCYFRVGIIGLIFAQIISQLMYNAWYWAIKAHQEMNLNLREMLQISFDETKRVFYVYCKKLI